MKTIIVRIDGVTPLLCNRFHEESQMSATNNTSASTVGDRGTPKEQAEKKLYLDNEGLPMIPQPNIFRCIIDGGKFFKAGKSKVTTQKNSLVAACVEVEGLGFRIIHNDPWTVDWRPIRNPSTGGRRLCYRPCFEDWALEFVINLDEEIIGIKLLREIVDCAGKRIGLGDFRPDCKGPFGKFVVTRWDVQADEAERIAA